MGHILSDTGEEVPALRTSTINQERPRAIAIKLFNTLKSRLMLLFGGLILATTALGTWLISSLAVEELRKSTSQNLQEVAVQLRDKIEIDLHERYSDLSIAAAVTTQTLEGDQSVNVTSILNALQDNFPSYAWIGLVSAEGTVLSSTGNLLEGVDVSERPWFREASKGPYLGDAHPALLLESKLDNPSASPLRFVDVAVPLYRNDGTLMGVLGAHLYLQWVASVGESLLAPLQERLQVELVVADRNGTVLIGPKDTLGTEISGPLADAAAGKPTSGYLTDTMTASSDPDDQERYLIGFSRLRDRDEYTSFDWLVLVRKPTDEAFAPANELRLTLVATGFLVSLLLLLSAAVAARWTTRPLLRMTEEARNLDPEQPSTLIRQRDDYEEVSTLSSTLRNLILKLTAKTREMNELNTTLEHRVEERTRELEDTNALLEDEIVQRDAMRRERETLIRQLEETVRTDALTGLNNRRHYFELGKTAVKKALRSRKPLSAIMFDADYFKKVNDSYGHGVGDKALVHLSQLAAEALRDIDVLARVGGEEFAVLLENTDEQSAAEVAERLRSTIEDHPLPLERGRLTLTISAGVATFLPDNSDDLDTLLLYADKALYQAKTGGRNRVFRYSDIQQANSN